MSGEPIPQNPSQRIHDLMQRRKDMLTTREVPQHVQDAFATKFAGNPIDSKHLLAVEKETTPGLSGTLYRQYYTFDDVNPDNITFSPNEYLSVMRMGQNHEIIARYEIVQAQDHRGRKRSHWVRSSHSEFRINISTTRQENPRALEVECKIRDKSLKFDYDGNGMLSSVIIGSDEQPEKETRDTVSYEGRELTFKDGKLLRGKKRKKTEEYGELIWTDTIAEALEHGEAVVEDEVEGTRTQVTHANGIITIEALSKKGKLLESVTLPYEVNYDEIVDTLIDREITKDPMFAPASADQSWRKANLLGLFGVQWDRYPDLAGDLTPRKRGGLSF